MISIIKYSNTASIFKGGIKADSERNSFLKHNYLGSSL